MKKCSTPFLCVLTLIVFVFQIVWNILSMAGRTSGKMEDMYPVAVSDLVDKYKSELMPAGFVWPWAWSVVWALQAFHVISLFVKTKLCCPKAKILSETKTENKLGWEYFFQLNVIFVVQAVWGWAFSNEHFWVSSVLVATAVYLSLDNATVMFEALEDPETKKPLEEKGFLTSFWNNFFVLEPMSLTAGWLSFALVINLTIAMKASIPNFIVGSDWASAWIIFLGAAGVIYTKTRFTYGFAAGVVFGIIGILARNGDIRLIGWLGGIAIGLNVAFVFTAPVKRNWDLLTDD